MNGTVMGLREGGESKDEYVAREQHPAQLDTEQYAQHTDNEKQTHAHGDRYYEHGGVDVRDIGGQDLEVRLRNSDGYAQNEAEREDEPELARLCHPCACVVADLSHRRFYAEGKPASSPS